MGWLLNDFMDEWIYQSIHQLMNYSCNQSINQYNIETLYQLIKAQYRDSLSIDKEFLSIDKEFLSIDKESLYCVFINFYQSIKELLDGLIT